MLKLFQRIQRDESGATAIEYGLIVSLIVIAIIGSMNSFANESNGLWTGVQTKVSAATTKAAG